MTHTPSDQPALGLDDATEVQILLHADRVPADLLGTLERAICPTPDEDGHHDRCPLMTMSIAPAVAPAGTRLAGIVAAETLEWTAVYVKPGDRYPDEDEKLTPGWYVLAQDPDLDPENGAPVILQVSALNLNADHADCGEDRAQQVAEALARMLGGAR